MDDRTITIFAKIPRDAAVPVRLDETNLVRQGDEIRGRVKLLTFLFRHAARSVITNVPNADGSWG